MVLEGFYRVQIIAHKQPLNEAVFEGIENVLSFPGDDGWIRYMTGTFVEYADAINHMREMRVRGFDDAFIVTFRNGKRINLNIALSSNDIRKSPLVEIEEESVDIDFNIQLLIAASNRDVENSQKMKKLGSVSKEQLGTGTIIKYTLGPYKNLTDAENKLKVVREAGFLDAFIFSVMEGERIPLYKAKSIIK